VSAIGARRSLRLSRQYPDTWRRVIRQLIGFSAIVRTRRVLPSRTRMADSRETRSAVDRKVRAFAPRQVKTETHACTAATRNPFPNVFAFRGEKSILAVCGVCVSFPLLFLFFSCYSACYQAESFQQRATLVLVGETRRCFRGFRICTRYSIKCTSFSFFSFLALPARGFPHTAARRIARIARIRVSRYGQSNSVMSFVGNGSAHLINANYVYRRV